MVNSLKNPATIVVSRVNRDVSMGFPNPQEKLGAPQIYVRGALRVRAVGEGAPVSREALQRACAPDLRIRK